MGIATTIRRYSGLIYAGILIVAVAVAVRHWGWEVVHIPSASMVPAIWAGDYVLVEKWSVTIGHREPCRGEVVVFTDPQGRGTRLVKRVIGLAGERVEIRERQVLVNGVPIGFEPVTERVTGVMGNDVNLYRETLATSHYVVWYDAESWDVPRRIVAGDREVIVFGDNRDNSVDSRDWGPLPQERIVGYARRVLFSRDPKGGHVRWDRIGAIIP